ncbi:MAG: hypothetical protein L0I24_17925 [Pseudonocardia sp.]|nr:hypothetical protein [Pseudonocardia sp.]
MEKLRSEIVDLRRQVSELTKARVELDKRLAVVAREKAELTIRVEQLDKLTRRLQRLGGRRHGG